MAKVSRVARLTRSQFHLSKMMLEDMRNDPVLAHEIIFRDPYGTPRRTPPAQRAAMRKMWVSAVSEMDSGRDTMKSSTAIILMVLQCILWEDTLGGILSKVWSQVRELFEYIDTWYGAYPFFAYQCRDKPSHRNEAHEQIFKNNSRVRALPPDLTRAEGNKLRSERWNIALLDEWHTWPNLGIIDTVIEPIVTRPNLHEHPGAQNKIYYLNTGDYEFNPAFKRRSYFKEQAGGGNKDYAYIHFNVIDHILAFPGWENVFPVARAIEQARELMPVSEFEKEWKGKWQKDSDGFYPASVVRAMSKATIKIELKRLFDAAMYVLGVDVASGASGKGDDATLSVIRLDGGRDVSVWQKCMVGIKSAGHIAWEVHKAHEAFGFSWILMDAGGGGYYVREELRKDHLEVDGELRNFTPIVCPADPMTTETECAAILSLFSMDDPFLKQYMAPVNASGLRKWGGADVLNNSAHKNARERIGAGLVDVATFTDPYDRRDGARPHQAAEDAAEIEEASYAMELSAGELTAIDDPAALHETRLAAGDIQEALDEIIAIGPKRDKDKRPVLTIRGQLSFVSSIKKDSALSFVYGLYCAEMWRRMSGDVDVDEAGGGPAGAVATASYDPHAEIMREGG